MHSSVYWPGGLFLGWWGLSKNVLFTFKGFNKQKGRGKGHELIWWQTLKYLHKYFKYYKKRKRIGNPCSVSWAWAELCWWHWLVITMPLSSGGQLCSHVFPSLGPVGSILHPFAGRHCKLTGQRVGIEWRVNN